MVRYFVNFVDRHCGFLIVVRFSTRDRCRSRTRVQLSFVRIVDIVFRSATFLMEFYTRLRKSHIPYRRTVHTRPQSERTRGISYVRMDRISCRRRRPTKGENNRDKETSDGSFSSGTDRASVVFARTSAVRSDRFFFPIGSVYRTRDRSNKSHTNVAR